MPYITPITDRSQDDIDDRTSRAFFNVSDWQRIHNNTQTAKILVSVLLSVVIPQNSVIDPTISTIPTVSELNLFLENIENVRIVTSLPAIIGLEEIKHDWIAGRSAGVPTYTVVNSWERVLDIIYSAIVKDVEYAIYCGVATSGQPRFYQHRFRQYAWIPDAASPVRRARTGIAVSGAGLTKNNDFRRY